MELLNEFLVQLFKAGDAAKIIGVPTDTLAHWRKNSVVRFEKPGRGWTRYTGRDLVSFSIIRDAQHYGYSYDLAREFAEYATSAVDELVDLLARHLSGKVSTSMVGDFCLIGIYDPVSLDGASLAELRKAWENKEPFSGPSVRVFTSREKLASHLKQREWAEQSGLPFHYIPTIDRLVARWMVTLAEEQ
jgi:hypothetical protein